MPSTAAPTTANGSLHPPAPSKPATSGTPNTTPTPLAVTQPANRLPSPFRRKDFRKHRNTVGRHQRRTDPGEEATRQQGPVVPRQDGAEHAPCHEQQSREQHQAPSVNIGDRTHQRGRDPPGDGRGGGELPRDGDRGLELVRQRHQERPQHHH